MSFQRPPSARPPTSGVPHGMRPPSRTRNGTEISAPGKGINVNVVSRPISKQGLPSAHTQSGERQVADKSYFIGILRTKINELLAEINRMKEELESNKRNKSIEVNLLQDVQNLRKEISDSEAILADYNVLSDRVANGTSVDDIIGRFQGVEQSNALYEEDVNKLFKEKRELESEVVKKEKKVQELMKGEGSPELQAMAKQIQDLEGKLGEMKSSTGSLEGKSREELLQMVKESTKQLTDVETEIRNTQKSLQFVQNQIKNLDDREGDLQTERGQQYLKLLQREKDMNNFLQNYSANMEQAKQELANIQRRVFEALVNTTHDIESISELPTVDNFKQMQTDLAYKERQMQDAQSTMQHLQVEVENRRREFEDLQNVDKKILNEIDLIKKKMEEMEEEMPNYEDVQSIRQEGEIRKKEKLKERDNLKAQLHNLKKKQNRTATKYNETRSQLRSNEVQNKLHTIEKEIRSRALENFTTMEGIEENRRRTNYAIVKRAAMNIVSEINSLL